MGVRGGGMINLFQYLLDIMMDVIDRLFGLLINTGLLKSDDGERNTGDPYGDCEAELYHDYQD